MTKRMHDISEVTKSGPNATINGVLTSLSPMKRSRSSSFFEGSITDGKASMRLYGFDSTVRRKLSHFMDATQSVVLDNCEVKPSRLNDNLELYVSPRTEMERSAKSYEVHHEDKNSNTTGKEVLLADIDDLPCYERVTVNVKVSNVDEEFEVKGGKRKQDVVVTDSSGVARFTVWEEDIGRLQKGHSYKLIDVMIREYSGKKYLSTALENSHIEEVTDIGEVINTDMENLDQSLGITQQLHDVRVVGVIYLEEHGKCLKCGSKVIVSCEDAEIAKCIKCSMLQSLESCETTSVHES